VLDTVVLQNMRRKLNVRQCGSVVLTSLNSYTYATAGYARLQADLLTGIYC